MLVFMTGVCISLLNFSVDGDMQVYQLTVVQLTVVARDRGPDAMPTDAAVVVRIIDVNDNAPTIAVNTLASRGTGTGGDAVAEVPENLSEGTFVAHVTVADADSEEFGRVDCNLTDNAFSLRRRPDSTEFQVSFLLLQRGLAFTCIKQVVIRNEYIGCDDTYRSRTGLLPFGGGALRDPSN